MATPEGPRPDQAVPIDPTRPDDQSGCALEIFYIFESTVFICILTVE